MGYEIERRDRKNLEFKPMLTVSIKDGVVLDIMGKKLGYVYDSRKYDEDYNRIDLNKNTED